MSSNSPFSSSSSSSSSSLGRKQNHVKKNRPQYRPKLIVIFKTVASYFTTFLKSTHEKSRHNLYDNHFSSFRFVICVVKSTYRCLLGWGSWRSDSSVNQRLCKLKQYCFTTSQLFFCLYTTHFCLDILASQAALFS